MAGDFSPLTIQADHGAPRAVPPALVLAMAVGLGTMDMPIPSVVEWEWLNWKFPRPVHSGDTIYARWTLTQKRPPASGATTSIVVWRVDVHTEDGAMCAEGEVGAKVRRSPGAAVAPRSRVAEPRQKAGEVPPAAQTPAATSPPAAAATRRRRRRRPGGGNGGGTSATPEAAPAPAPPPATNAAPTAERSPSAPRRRRRRRPATAGPRDSADGPAPASQVREPAAALPPAQAATPAPAASGRQAKSPLSRVIGRLRRT